MKAINEALVGEVVTPIYTNIDLAKYTLTLAGVPQVIESLTDNRPHKLTPGQVGYDANWKQIIKVKLTITDTVAGWLGNVNDELKLKIEQFKMPERDLPMVGLTATIKADRNALCAAGECFVEKPKDPIHTIVATIPRVSVGYLKVMLGLNTVDTVQNEYRFEFEQVNIFPVSTRFTFFFTGKRPKVYSANVADPN